MTVQLQMRSFAWNILFLNSGNDQPFAGLFNPPHANAQCDGALTFRDAIYEMALCFDFPGLSNLETPLFLDRSTTANEQRQLSGPWSNVAFAFAGLINESTDSDSPVGAASFDLPTLICHQEFDRPLPRPPPGNPADPFDGRPSIRFQLVSHDPCSISATEPLSSHIKAGCAKHIPKPIRRQDHRYLPPKKSSTDPRYARFPLRKTARARGISSRSPPKRSQSGSVLTRRDSGTPDINEDPEFDLSSIVAPPEMEVNFASARTTMDSFRKACLVGSGRCAQQYHLYPLESSVEGDGSNGYSFERLSDAWDCTWSVSNGILLLSHLHELFDGRWFSIHPDTHRIRVFVPYDVIEEYHGRKAKIPSHVSRAALWHHYDMCCIENMGAKAPLPEPQQATESGRSTPRTSYSINSGSVDSVPSLPYRRSRDTGNSSQARGDPSKRQHSASAQDNIEEYDDDDDDDDEELDKHSRKKRRLSKPVTVHNLSSFYEEDVPASLHAHSSDRFTEELQWKLSRLLPDYHG
ncbi:hypothetical protein PT974_04045 [Cladobotryum mycophilum]|uniref:HNH nuclease domain-containing protein n=1 Tax=Cladobotryum mycophilum TaxID=491253 RepID=A0ABR0SV61_9HYPO